MMKVKRFLIIVFALIILSLSLLPASAAEAEQAENTTVQVVISDPGTVPATTEPATEPYYDVTQISKSGFIVVVGMLSIIVGMMSAKAFSFWKW